MRKRGFKSKSDLQKENIELKKINKILTQEINSLKKLIGKREPAEEKENKKKQCVECNSFEFSFYKIDKIVFWVCKKCNHKEKI